MFNKIDFDTATMGQIADKLGELKARMAELSKYEKALKAAIIDGGVSAVEGKRYRVTVSHSERKTLDSAAVKAILTQVQIDNCTKVSDVTTVRCAAKTGEGLDTRKSDAEYEKLFALDR